MLSLHERVDEELEALATKKGVQLRQEDVVEAARNKGSALYEDFDRQGLWDDKKAAQQARLQYAGRLIRIYLIKPPGSDPDAKPVRGFVSLITERKPENRGYRLLQPVLENPTLREQLLQTGLSDLRAVRRKYESLKELAEIWDAIDSADRKYGRPKDPDSDSAAATA